MTAMISEPPALLARPVWYALNGAHAHLGQVAHGAARYDPQISPFLACARHDDAHHAALAALCQPGESLLFIEENPPEVVAGFETLSRRDCAQMTFLADVPPAARTAELVELGLDDAQAMHALATLTEPGPFAARTNEIGRFWGVKRDGRLVAMAGERLRAGEWTEVSGICTHPEHRGQGLAAALTAHVISGILGRGERPFLHSYADNLGTIRLYEGLGFCVARTVTVLAIARR